MNILNEIRGHGRDIRNNLNDPKVWLMLLVHVLWVSGLSILAYVVLFSCAVVIVLLGIV